MKSENYLIAAISNLKEREERHKKWLAERNRKKDIYFKYDEIIRLFEELLVLFLAQKIKRKLIK